LSAHFTPRAEAFLDEHPHVFLHNTPTHASWLNQVELFFSILERRLLRHGELASVDELPERIIAFIKDYNRRAKPFRWTYAGRPPEGRVSHNDLRARALVGGGRPSPQAPSRSACGTSGIRAGKAGPVGMRIGALSRSLRAVVEGGRAWR